MKNHEEKDLYTIHDIDVCVITRNRAEMLREVICALLGQTIVPDEITVFDNESTDHTVDVVADYAEKGVRYVRTTGRHGNFLAMQKCASRRYVVHFHDDNLIHPQYLERVLHCLNKEGDLVGVTSAYRYCYQSGANGRLWCSKDGIPIRFPKFLGTEYSVCRSAAEFVVRKARSECWGSGSTVIADNISMLVYDAKYFKERTILNDEFGRVDDAKVFVDLCKRGPIAILDDPNSEFVRVHAGRDSCDDATGLTVVQAKNWIRLYLMAARDVHNRNFWIDFLEMIYNQYQLLLSKRSYEKMPVKAFVAQLCECEDTPSQLKSLVREFPSGRSIRKWRRNPRGIKRRIMAALPSWLFTLVAGVSYVRCAVLARVLPGARRIRYRDKLPQKRKVLASSPARVIGRTGNDIWLPRGCRNVLIEVAGRGNRVRIGNLTRSTGQIRIRIEGSGNVVDIEHFEIGGPADIRLSGDNGTLTIGSLWVREGLTIMNGTEIRGERAFGARCTIGKGCTAESLKIYNLHADGVVQIGDGCMIAPEVVIMNSDSHPIYDRKTGAMINRPTRPLVIGAHSWLATHAVILKGAQLAAGTVVGYNATVSGRFEEENTVLAGCPARVVRRDVDWAAYGKGFV